MDTSYTHTKTGNATTPLPPVSGSRLNSSTTVTVPVRGFVRLAEPVRHGPWWHRPHCMPGKKQTVRGGGGDGGGNGGVLNGCF